MLRTVSPYNPLHVLHHARPDCSCMHTSLLTGHNQRLLASTISCCGTLPSCLNHVWVGALACTTMLHAMPLRCTRLLCAYNIFLKRSHARDCKENEQEQSRAKQAIQVVAPPLFKLYFCKYSIVVFSVIGPIFCCVWRVLANTMYTLHCRLRLLPFWPFPVVSPDSRGFA